MNGFDKRLDRIECILNQRLGCRTPTGADLENYVYACIKAMRTREKPPICPQRIALYLNAKSHGMRDNNGKHIADMTIEELGGLVEELMGETLMIQEEGKLP